MDVYKTKWFRKFQKKEGLTDAALCEAVARVKSGAKTVRLSHELIKERVGREGEGKRGGFRTIIAYRCGDRAVFIYGFAKNARENISSNDQETLEKTGEHLLNLDAEGIQHAIDRSELWKVMCNGEGKVSE